MMHIAAHANTALEGECAAHSTHVPRKCACHGSATGKHYGNERLRGLAQLKRG
jgi:hypothetical protein